MLNASSLWKVGTSEKWRRIHEELRVGGRQLLRTAPDRSVTFLHIPCPHPPFIYDGEGRYVGPITTRTDSPYDTAGYLRNLQYLDFLVGDFLGVLKANGCFDRSMVVFTSDHSWRKDSRGGVLDPDETRHVPLFIKFPYQQSGHRIDERYYLTRLQPLMRYALTRPGSDEGYLSVIRDNCGSE